MERLSRRVYCNPTEPLNSNPTPDRQQLSTSSKEEEKGNIQNQPKTGDRTSKEQK